MQTKLTLAVAAAVLLGVAGASATSYTLSVDPNLPPGTTDRVFGAANPGAPADATSEAEYINAALGLSLGGHTTVSPNAGSTDDVYRSLNSFSGLPAAGTVTASTVYPSGGAGTSTSITLTGGYTFLIAKYDGPNGGSEIWWIGDLVKDDTITIPQNGFGDGNDQYGLSGWELFTPTSQPPPPVPDGGLTLAMLGSALTGLALLRKKLS